ncbi:Protein of unknown function [Gryllus bimaculatus]|nr:Protein of unknown function [Gryllus bimaculatus]
MLWGTARREAAWATRGPASGARARSTGRPAAFGSPVINGRPRPRADGIPATKPRGARRPAPPIARDAAPLLSTEAAAAASGHGSVERRPTLRQPTYLPTLLLSKHPFIYLSAGLLQLLLHSFSLLPVFFALLFLM